MQWKPSVMSVLSITALAVSLTVSTGCNRASESAAPQASKTVAPMESVDGTGPQEPLVIPVHHDPTTVVVRVDGQILTQKEIDTEIDQRLAASPMPLSPDEKDQVRPKLEMRVIQEFVVKTLLKNEADRQKVTVNDAEIDDAIKEISTRLPSGMTLDDVMQARGVSLQELRNNVGGEVRIRKLIEAQVFTNTAPSDAEIAAFYEQNKESMVVPERVRARHILIKVDSSDTAKIRAEKKTKAENLLKKITEGADFAVMAKENSDDEANRDNGGELPVFTRREVDPTFAEAAFARATNTVGPVVETSFGYHLIQVLDHTTEKAMDLAEANKQIAQFIEKTNKDKAIGAYLEGLQDKAKIEHLGQELPVEREPSLPASQGKAAAPAGADQGTAPAAAPAPAAKAVPIPAPKVPPAPAK